MLTPAQVGSLRLELAKDPSLSPAPSEIVKAMCWYHKTGRVSLELKLVVRNSSSVILSLGSISLLAAVLVSDIACRGLIRKKEA